MFFFLGYNLVWFENKSYIKWGCNMSRLVFIRIISKNEIYWFVFYNEMFEEVWVFEYIVSLCFDGESLIDVV